MSCLEGLALEYVCKRKIDKYRDIKKEMSRRFNTKDNPISARRKLQFIRKHEGEMLQEFAQRVHFITIDGYSESGKKAIDQTSAESFLRDCRDKEAARSVMEKNTKNIHEALDLIKASIANQQAVYGSSKAYYHRQISFAPSEQHADTEMVFPYTGVSDTISKFLEVPFGRLLSLVQRKKELHLSPMLKFVSSKNFAKQ